MMGILKTAIRVVLFPALEAIPESSVNVVAKPNEPKHTFKINSCSFSTGFSKTKEYNDRAINPKNDNKIEL